MRVRVDPEEPRPSGDEGSNYVSVVVLPQEIENLREDIRSHVEKAGAELIDLAFRRVGGGRNVLTVIADKVGGITLDECAVINRSLSVFFDELALKAGEGSMNFAQSAYYLEVNSPGLDRPLVTEKDFARAMGENIRIIQRQDSGHTLIHIGQVSGIADGVVDIKTSSQVPVLRIPLDSIAKAVREIKIK